MQLTFETAREASPGAVLAKNIGRFWPAYRRWFLAGGGAQSASLAEASRALRDRMPELQRIFDRLVELGPDDPLFARFLTLYRPPAFIGACSIAVLGGGHGPGLVRNYDFDPGLAEGVILESAWRGRRVLGTADCLWGLVDGLNEDGLALALTFGGRREAADGFGIPLILRYVLETARDVPDALEALRAVPSHMAYNVGLVDRGGRHAVVHLAPGGGAMVAAEPVATNHQDRVHWPEQARFTASVQRKHHLLRLTQQRLATDAMADGFLEPPLYRTQYGVGFGTLYTAVLEPVARKVSYRWPGQHLDCTLGRLAGRSLTVTYLDGHGARWHPAPTVELSCDPTATAFAAALDGMAAGLHAAGCPADPGLVERLQGSDAPWARLSELWQPRRPGRLSG